MAAFDELHLAEAALAEEQAAVNAFRMHCRLKLGGWVDEILSLRAEKQRLLTALSLWQQAVENEESFDPFAWLDGSDEIPEEELPPLEDGYEPPVPTLPRDRQAEKRLYRELARRFHPDLAENSLQRVYATSMMAAINEAYHNRDGQALRDLAAELDPESAGEIIAQAAQNRQFLQLQQRLRRCRLRRRKVARQLVLLRQEKIARLWQKARQVEKQDGENWWDEVAATLREDIERTRTEIDDLRRQLLHTKNPEETG